MLIGKRNHEKALDKHSTLLITERLLWKNWIFSLGKNTNKIDINFVDELEVQFPKFKLGILFTSLMNDVSIYDNTRVYPTIQAASFSENKKVAFQGWPEKCFFGNVYQNLKNSNYYCLQVRQQHQNYKLLRLFVLSTVGI